MSDDRRAHIARMTRGRPDHIHGDLFHRLPADMREQLEEMWPDPASTTVARKLANHEIASYLHAELIRRGDELEFGPCDLHADCFCSLYGRTYCGGDRSLTGVTAGVTRVDSSTMNNFASGDGGRTYAAIWCSASPTICRKGGAFMCRKRHGSMAKKRPPLLGWHGEQFMGSRLRSPR